MNRRTFLVVTGGLWASACVPMGRADSVEAVWGDAGRGNGQFVRPRAIGVDNGEVFVVDTTGRVQVFTEEGAYLRQWQTPSAENGTPTCITFGTGGVVYIPDTHYSQVLVYSRKGELLEQWGTFGHNAGEFVYPTGLVEFDDGTTYVSEYGVNAEQVRVFDSERNDVRQFGTFGEAPGAFNRAMAIVKGPEDSLLVADTGNNRIQRLDIEGNVLDVTGEAGTEPGQLKDPFDVAASADGVFCVPEFGTSRVSVFDNGKLVTCIGGPGRNEGQFDGPRGVAISPDSRTVFVADTDNHRIQRFDLAAVFA